VIGRLPHIASPFVGHNVGGEIRAQEAVKATGATTSITFVAPAFAADAIMEAADAARHDVRIDPLQRVITKIDVIEHAGTVIVDDNVRGLD